MQVERLDQVFESLGKSAKGKTCEAMQGLTAEMEEDLEAFGESEAADDVLIGCAQAIEHYEIARYGLLKNWARKLGLTEAEQLLGETLEEEKRTDLLLTQIAEGFETAEGDETEVNPDETPEEGEASTPKRASGARKAKA